MDPRRAAFDLLGGRYDVRILEPSPPAVAAPPWCADDPVRADPIGDGRACLLPFPNAAPSWDDVAAADDAVAEFARAHWLGAWPALVAGPDRDAYLRTRVGLHALAEHVLASARYLATGRLGLRFTSGGFGTPFFGADCQVRVHGVDLVVEIRGEARVEPITTVRTAAAVLGHTPGPHQELYPPTTAVDPDAPLHVDPASAGLIADWFGFGASVLEQLRFESPADLEPGRVQLWPEHFDLALELGRSVARGTFGASAGDAAHPWPYLYVTHGNAIDEGSTDPFWNDTAFDGASLGLEALASAAATGAGQRARALDFFRAGLDALASRTDDHPPDRGPAGSRPGRTAARRITGVDRSDVDAADPAREHGGHDARCAHHRRTAPAGGRPPALLPDGRIDRAAVVRDRCDHARAPAARRRGGAAAAP